MADGAACFRQDSSGPALLRILLRVPDRSRSQASTMSESYNPGRAVTLPVWALPRSLATTCGIIVIFSSCGYLDVSVPRVCPLRKGCPHRCGRVVPFGNPRIKGYLHLPGAYRSLSRPSSPLRARSLQTSRPCGHGLACQAFFFQYVNELSSSFAEV